MIRKLLLLLVILIIVQTTKAQQAAAFANCFYDNTTNPHRIVIRLALENKTSAQNNQDCELVGIRIGLQFNSSAVRFSGYKSYFNNGSPNTGLDDNTFLNPPIGVDTDPSPSINLDGTRTASINNSVETKLLQKAYFNRSTSNCNAFWLIPKGTYRLAVDFYFEFQSGYTPDMYNLTTDGSYGFIEESNVPNNFIAQKMTSLDGNLLDNKKEIAIILIRNGLNNNPYQPFDLANCKNGNINPITVDGGIQFINPINGILSGKTESFTALEKNNNIQLDWKVENNELVDHYELERKDENGEFKTIAMIMSDNKYSTTSYQYTDKITTREQQLYYRVKTVGLDQISTYSDVKTIKLRSVQQPNIKVYPNPSSDVIRVDLPIATGSYVCRLYNSEGRMVKVENLSYPNASILVNTLVNGNYFVELYHPQSGKRFYSQFTKQ